MKLSAKLADDFSPTIRARGERYYWQRRVTIRQGSDSMVDARVQGSLEYSTSLQLLEEDEIAAWCSCDYFEANGPCKHLWAVVRTAEEKGYLSLAAAQEHVYLESIVVDGDDSADGSSDDSRRSVFAAEIAGMPRPAALRPPAPREPAWRSQIADISSRARRLAGSLEWPAKRQIVYMVELRYSVPAGAVVVALETREPKADGTWKRSKPLQLTLSQIALLPQAEDREILSMLAGGKQHYSYGRLDNTFDRMPLSCVIAHPLAAKLIPLIVGTGRCYLRTNAAGLPEDAGTVLWDDAGAWRLELQMHPRKHGGWTIHGVLRRGDQQIELAAPALITHGGLVFTADRVAPLAEDTSIEWISNLRRMHSIEAPEKDEDELLSALLCSPGLPAIQVPEELRYEEIMPQPRPCLRIAASDPAAGNSDRLRGKLSFDYEDHSFHAHDASRGRFESEKRRFLRRNPAAETDASTLLTELGAKLQGPVYRDPEPAWEITSAKLPRMAQALLAAGWLVEAQGKAFHHPGALRMEVSSGVDWFELHGEVEYGGSRAQLPELLQALRRGGNMVRLDNGDFGMLPEEWLRRFGPVAGLGTVENNHLRFGRSQAGLLDALLLAQPEARCDETFARVRQELGQFQGVEAAEQPAGFVGHLRDYQREGLGWMHFLRRFSFGGCLADDMGVGKTAQVLALLEGRRELRSRLKKDETPIGPSLVVMPRSLIFNWKLEAERFTPKLRVLDYTGLARTDNEFSKFDVVLTTYGTLRRDALRLKDIEFDYVVLDEAQAVKNATTESAKAVRLLRGNHRLALSGTPMENHLGELWTLFEFLNPGMLGAAGAFKLAGGAARNPDEDTRRLLASALRPFILRRTKEQVARELPAKTEQTIYCEMKPPQRKLYNELLQHYRDSLLKRIEEEGMAKSKIHVLEALLRLRQAACHPGLIDKARSADPSAKLEMLIERLTEVLEEGHKALVFSQFTSLLSIVRNRLDASGITYEYLDGKTRDRQTHVERFQNDPECKLFLVSLKAGGLGLNLTAAEYVFLLDPWWNPAVEMQAIDRAHRIGQTKQVFAYRLIARDTIEEKVLQLQATKRDLAAAIIGEDNSLIRNLKREDLEVLLS